MRQLQVSGNSAAVTALLTSVSAFSKMVNLAEHVHHKLALLYVKCLKSAILYSDAVKDLFEKGGDAIQRMKRDGKLELVSSACSHKHSQDIAMKEITEWMEANDDVVQLARSAEAIVGACGVPCRLNQTLPSLI